MGRVLQDPMLGTELEAALRPERCERRAYSAKGVAAASFLRWALSTSATSLA
jgi:hypothetical protein